MNYDLASISPDGFSGYPYCTSQYTVVNSITSILAPSNSNGRKIPISFIFQCIKSNSNAPLGFRHSRIRSGDWGHIEG